ncbi:MFS transporter [Paraflavisolibacter sp. H34]|uniref:MFS transporter n=1 Tax=Huijunlia imazamoxiresistens TaxID=3127457 RepID=UPI0030171397
MNSIKPKLSFLQIVNMNAGFFGLQYSFGLQQANMSPIYSYLGAEESRLPYLWLAGPVTGLIIQPIVGALSDLTVSRWGRRTPYFLLGALFCSLCLFLMPHSRSVWMAASLLWILDAANNITQEPYRAFVSDKLPAGQHPLGFLMQSAFTGLGQTLSYLTPTLLLAFGVSKFARNANGIPLTTLIAFVTGSVLSIGSVLWTLKTTREIPLTAGEADALRRRPRGGGAALREIWDALRDMPPAMKQMVPMMLFSWYALFIYWIYIAKCLSLSVYGTTEASAAGFREGELLAGQLGACYNFIAFAAAFALAALARKTRPQVLHACCLAAAGAGLFVLPFMHHPALAFLPIAGLGLAWASMMGTPYVILAGSIPPERTGVYMGIFNLFIVIPMLLQNLTMPLYYESWLHHNPAHAIRLAGILLLLAAVSALWVKTARPPSAAALKEEIRDIPATK